MLEMKCLLVVWRLLVKRVDGLTWCGTKLSHARFLFFSFAVRHALSNGFNASLLRSLDLSRSCLTDKHVSVLCATLQGCILLERLSLSFNGLEWEGVRDISQLLLPHLRALSCLDLSHCGCGGWTHDSCAVTRRPSHLHRHAFSWVLVMVGSGSRCMV